MTPEESLQHEWIKEGLVHKRKEQHGSKHKHHTPATADSEKSTDPYKVPAQPVKGKKPSKFCQLKETKSATMNMFRNFLFSF